MDFERKLKNKTIFAVMIVLLVLCAIYFSLGIKNQKQYINWQIQKENDIVNIEIKNLLNTTNQIYRDKIQYFVNNPEIKQRFSSNDVKDLYQKVFPFYTILKSEDPYHFSFNFYSKDNSLVLNMDTGNGLDIKAAENSIVAKVNIEKIKKTGFEFVNSNLYYKVVEPVIYKGKYVGCIEFGIRENEVVERISKDFNVTIASVFNPKNLEDLAEEFKSSVSNEYFVIHSLIENDVFAEIVSKNESLIPGKFKYKESYYYLDVIKVENNFLKEGFEGVIYFRNISALQNKFIATVYRSILIIFLILISTFIILHFSFNALIHKIFNLQDSLDQRLAQKTNEIVNKNAELNQIFNTTGNSMRLIDIDHNILRVNRAFTMLSGISKEDAEGKKCYNIFPGAHCHTSECPLNKIKNGEDRVEVDVMKKNTQGKVIPGILNSVAFKGQNGEILGIIEDFKDISKRLEAEDALKRTEQQFSIFMDNLPLGVFIKDENLKSVYLNKYMDFIYSNDNCKSKTPQEIFPEEYAQRVIQEDMQVLNGKVLVVEDQLPDKSGNLKTYQTHKFRYRGTDNTWQIGGVSLDITEKKKTEQDLKILSNAIHHSPACVIITNLKREIQFVNPSFTQITGYNPEDVINKEISLLSVDNHPDSIYEEAMSYVLSGKDWQGEFHHQKKNGEKYWELASISPVKNNKGEISHFVVISEDITSRKKNEKELIDAKEKAEESNRLKTAFLANLSHEIRTPMNAIIGFSNLLLDEDMSFEEKVKLNNLINDNSNNLLKLIDDVIDISKIQAGDIELNKTDCFINKLLLDLYVTFSIKVENDDKKDIHLSLQKNTSLNDFSFVTDPLRLKQILYNLIENAIKFTSKGFVEFGYSIIEEENKIQFYVIDSGIGISNEKFDLIYDLFRQADESFTREHGGTGIGLTIAKKLVDHLNGDIWIQSTPKQGTNIYFTLPLKEQEAKIEESKIISDYKYDWQNKVVLVADDIDLNYQLIEEILTPTKAKILWAKDGQEAVNLCLNNNNIDLVLMDINMPVMDGLEATQRIKQHKKELKIFGQTAYIRENDREKCLNAGFDNYISKPIKIDSLLSIIDQIFTKN
jgi:PAS domain S-box-containing protein